MRALNPITSVSFVYSFDQRRIEAYRLFLSGFLLYYNLEEKALEHPQ